MKEIVLPAVYIETAEFATLEQRIKDLLKEQIYLPLIYELGQKKSDLIANAIDDLIAAIKTGKITYYRGGWRGKFTAQISRELSKLGAKWDRKSSRWLLPESSLPIDVRHELKLSQSAWQSVTSRLNRQLQEMLPEQIAEKLNADKLFESALFKTDSKMRGNLKGMTVMPELTQKQRAEIASGYTNDMKRYIKDFASKEIKTLRHAVEKSAMLGTRHEGLVKDLQQSYGVSRNKAKFLARQETNLMMSKFEQVRYTGAGINEYDWSCVRMPHDPSPSHHTLGNVRYSHGILDGTRQQWNNPPITTNPGEPARRNHPGQDYNCRCKAKPVVKF